MPVISVSNLTKRYGGFMAVDDLTFDVEVGEIVGFLGPNGAGKTTTMRMLTCFMPATSGKATVAGHDIFTESLKVRRSIGYMPENVPLYPEMRVGEYLAFRARIKRVPRSQRRVRIAECLEKSGCVEVRDQVIRQLSRGYRQRVGLADALVSDPPVLILDEPLASLDPNQQRLAKSVIRELQDKHTVLFSSHILSDVEEVCSRLLILHEGKLVAAGTCEELTAKYRGRALVAAQVRGPVEAVKKALEGIPGVEGVRAEHKGSLVELAVEAREEVDPREEIAKVVVQNGWGLQDIRFDTLELSEIFARLTAPGGEEAD